ncbi:hypothetical protein Alches_01940 [Alicyclobacillus hesperidum subsp. aegles]|uniref:Uncharacterized protein n=1 Tax=Alicyclobacillus hesperidum TaxID=89784 RepID=A0A1H2W3N2_9BACL|nr:hypothetical protein [Alicyclobacillus hesperidum]GLG00155.1 hypothetical protein Alches_01940 [Alicyclobacillus hesperidum subsp. aegles]GLV14829.1 hypothetical protein Heshes_25130 [Alicyclobacillus hesperidum]SDW74864.1 hypothetical protein SAMN04489725_11344 [Alicyclobacillus hesperidum]
MSLHKHWEVESICPRCEKVNVVQVPEGEHVVRVHCTHCEHGYDYTHIVKEFTEVEDD